MFCIQAPCLTPEWNRTSHGQTVFYTEHRCIPLQGQCHLRYFILAAPVHCRSLFLTIFCATGLSQDLEELMVEGLLLQVSLPEVLNLYHVLLDRTSSQHTNRFTSPPRDELADCDTHGQFNSQGNDLPLDQVQTSTKIRYINRSERRSRLPPS